MPITGVYEGECCACRIGIINIGAKISVKDVLGLGCLNKSSSLILKREPLNSQDDPLSHSSAYARHPGIYHCRIYRI